jgi:serine phosphatase RsbU (regulator of sigma subunit)/Tfp pilus assembly protein PilF
MYFQRIILLLIAFFLVPLMLLPAQENPQADSLRALLETAEGEDRLEILIGLSKEGYIPADDRLDYALEAINLATELGNTELLVDALMEHGFIYYDVDEYDNALNSITRAYEISREAGYSLGMANALILSGRVYSYTGEVDLAIEKFSEAKEIASREKHPELEAKALYHIGLEYRWSAQYDLAIKNFDLARPLAEEAKDLELLSEIYGDEGLVMFLKGDFQQAIQKYEEAVELYNQAGAREYAGQMYLRLGNAYLSRADYDVALNYLQQALPIFEEYNFDAGITAVMNSMGRIYFSQELFDKALEVHFRHLERSRELGVKEEIANSLNNIGTIYCRLAEDSLRSLFGESFQDSVKIESTDKYLRLFSEALPYYNEALSVYEELGNIGGIVMSHINIGIVYVYSGKPAMALEPLEQALELNRELNNIASQAAIYLLLGEVHLAFGNYDMAEDYLHNALELAQEADTKEVIMNIFEKLSITYEKQSDYIRALRYSKLHFAINDSLNQEKRRKAIADMQVKYETEATEKENALLLAQSELDKTKLTRNRIILIITIVAIGLFIVMMIQLIRQNNLKKKANKELEQSNKLITEQKKEITDSIQYASRIQNAMLPPGDYVDNLMPERFIIYMPRDIVSGDYYYITEKDRNIICVAADCTGHGVPGAFMSLLGIAFLNQIISKHVELHTDEILFELRDHVINSLHQTGREGESQDGMDVALYILDPKTGKMEFSGANNSLLVFRNGEMIEAKADKMPIGIHKRYQESFTRHNLELQKGDMIYTFSDGYPDQFGGPKQKKFMIKNFKRMLQEIHMKSAAEQKGIMEQTLKNWMADNDQVDDILVIGVRI